MASNLEQVRQWIEAGRQVGKRLRYDAGGRTYRLAVGVQKWQGKYMVFVSEVLAENLTVETTPTRSERIACADLAELERFFTTIPAVTLGELTPLKGYKLFNVS